MNGQPMVDMQVTLTQTGADVHNTPGLTLPNPEGSRNWVQASHYRWTKTDSRGRFEFAVGPGKYRLAGPEQTESVGFELTPDSQTKIVDFKTQRSLKGTLKGYFQTGNPPVPAAGIQLTGIYRDSRVPGRDIEITTDDQGRFEIERYQFPIYFYGRNNDQTIAGALNVDAEQTEMVLILTPTSAATGRLLNENGQPMPSQDIQYGINVPIGLEKNAPFRTSFGKTVKTDDQGQFALTGLLQSGTYDLSIPQDFDRQGHPQRWSRVAKVTPKPDQIQIDLGDVKFTPYKPYVPPTLEERIATAFKADQPILERFEKSLSDIKIGHIQMLVIFASPEDPLIKQYFEARGKAPLRSMMDDYWQTPFATTGKTQAASLALATDLGLTVDPSVPQIVVIDEHRKVLSSKSLDSFTDSETLNAEKLNAFLKEHALKHLDSRTLLDDALNQAKRDNKQIFVSQGATWCGPCWMLSRFLHKHKELLSEDYLFVKLDERWSHTKEIVEHYRGDREPGGIPWSFILDSDGNLLITSDGTDGNIGFPSEHDSIIHFMKMLQETRLRLTDDNLAIIENDLKK